MTTFTVSIPARFQISAPMASLNKEVEVIGKLIEVTTTHKNNGTTYNGKMRIDEIKAPERSQIPRKLKDLKEKDEPVSISKIAHTFFHQPSQPNGWVVGLQLYLRESVTLENQYLPEGWIKFVKVYSKNKDTTRVCPAEKSGYDPATLIQKCTLMAYLCGREFITAASKSSDKVRDTADQKNFKEKLIGHYGESRCFVTGTLLAVEACHIVPWSVCSNYDLNNGLLLRRDIHFLLDQRYWKLERKGNYIYVKIIDDRMRQDPCFQSIVGKKLGRNNSLARKIFDTVVLPGDSINPRRNRTFAGEKRGREGDDQLSTTKKKKR